MKGADYKRIELTKEDEKVDIMTKDDNQVSAELAFSADFQESEGRHQSLTRVDSIWAPIVWRLTQLPHPHAFENMSDMHLMGLGESQFGLYLFILNI